MDFARRCRRWAGLIILVGLASVQGIPVAAQEEPSLPPGLGEPDEPALPPGLGEEGSTRAQETSSDTTWLDRLTRGMNGFAELRFGPRIGRDAAHTKRYTLAETRLQVQYEQSWKFISVDAKGDLILDAVLEEAQTDLRGLRLTFRPPGPFDLRIGRQVMTWGTGDLLFINDLFPKDWQSFLIGRDEEYLKAPADSLRVGWFPGAVSVDLAYSPSFQPDRFIRGERITFWDPQQGGFRGDAMPLATDVPERSFDDDETAARIYGSVGSLELAAYAYRGFWKSPAGFDPLASTATFPALDVWGASVRGPLGPGIGNVEFGYYDSRSDPGGADALVNNSELRALVGYELELGPDLTGAFQLYLEHMLDYEAYLTNLPGGTPRDENRYLLTTRITKLLRAQTLIPALFLYYSPSDGDGYLRPKLSWKRSDRQTLEFGINLFFGRQPNTFFGQFENNSNVYASIRFQP